MSNDDNIERELAVSNALLQIINTKPTLTDIPIDEIEEKIDYFYSLGYVYEPYFQKFINPFIDLSFKVQVINNSIESIEEQHNNVEKDFLLKNFSFKTIPEITDFFYKINKFYNKVFFLEGASGIFGFILLLISIFLYFNNKLFLAVMFLLVSYILSHSYYVRNFLVKKTEGVFKLSRFWLKIELYYPIYITFLYIYSYFLLYTYLDSFWEPIIIIGALKSFINRMVKLRLSNQYLYFAGFGQLTDYINSKS